MPSALLLAAALLSPPDTLHLAFTLPRFDQDTSCAQPDSTRPVGTLDSVRVVMYPRAENWHAAAPLSAWSVARPVIVYQAPNAKLPGDTVRVDIPVWRVGDTYAASVHEASSGKWSCPGTGWTYGGGR